MKSQILRPVPTFDQMMWPTLQALVNAGGSATNQEIHEQLLKSMRIPEDVQNVLHGEGPGTEVQYRMAWARTYLKKASAIENSTRGIWSLTPYGKTLTEEDVAVFPAKVRKKVGDENSTTLVASDDEAEIGWKEELLPLLKDMPPDGFERLAQRILRESGFVKVDVTGRSGDGGIDGIGVLRLTLISFQVFFQCKRYKDTVTPSTIRDFRGAMVGRTDKGLVITTGRFTSEAKREANRDGAPPVELIDGDQLCDLLKELKLGVKTQLVEQVSVDPLFFKEI